ncbi:ectoine/hydroxyectoine ABC transporter substrate-binding protein EhuB [Planomicrobium sp. CPCC 101079]|uniref:ectoine/hydroxyectoine ABC transporter substrate-binding protein EhuB n=1 Tax=Planomicrobium sp. CPCC 101079 TaxID=2599618 RepID=UPI0011B7D95C|nr:ectoine/hydroxyectoine ABC transporter substrate-binding protein EhuB [Planomicrobium sp. CPCC 101079]TWT11128.1 ectoine/hydroxyectoine ABC transporter substrate-binding protein EhuB [Planomicrobium sp. CPCC 101079]
MKKWKQFTSGSIAFLMLAACSSGGGGSGSTLQTIEEEGTVTVGFANERPYAYQENDGSITGQSVEIARAVFAEMGVEEVEGTVVDFDSLISGLNSRNFDAVTAGMYITPERCENAAFGEPEYRIGIGIATQAGNPMDINSYEDIASNPDAKVAVMAGAIEREYMLANGVADDQIQQVNDISAVITALDTGRVDAITMTDLTLRTALQDQDAQNIEIVEGVEQPLVDGEEVIGYGAAVFHPDDQELVDRYNEVLAEFKESGKLLELMEPFGFTEENLPGDVTTEELCAG